MTGLFPIVPPVTVASFSGRFDQPTRGSAQPHGRVTVLLELGSGSMTVAGRQERLLIVGLQHTPTAFVHQGSIDCVEIKLAPSVAVRLGFGLGDLVGSVAPLNALLGSDADRLANRLASATVADRAVVVQNVVRDRLRRVRTTSVVNSLQRLERTRSTDDLRAVASEAGISRSTLWRQTKAALGVSPQHYVALRRFELAASMLGKGLPAAQVATTAGYFDQAHMHRDIRRFANISPRELKVEQNATYVQDDGAVSGEY